MAMTSGKADAMKLYTGGKLKVSGDVMASQKLNFLQKIDPKEALAAIIKKRGGAAAAAPATSAPAAAAPAAAPAAINRESFASSDVFTAIEDHVARNPDLVTKIGKVFVFKLTSPESSWTIDVKNGKGGVQAGASAADTTLELCDADFLAMTSGKADAMKLYMGGKLKIGGDVMASQKLNFLQKIDPKQALEAVMKKRGGAASGPAPTTTSVAPSAAASAPGIFKALAERLAKNAGLAKEVGAVLQFNVTNPNAGWVVDLTGVGAVREGSDAKAGAAFRIDDADLAGLCKDPGRARDLYQHGKLRVDGDVRIAHKLGFLKDLI
jgi:3-hydroxyacyl-CoA dehydrogenase/3a,7a,12a-trihydroxy-5b-cholest-24-enoyl-CoA hydratase